MNVDFVPFILGVRVLCKPRPSKPRLIFSRINGPIVFDLSWNIFKSQEKLQTMVMQKLWDNISKGVLWNCASSECLIGY